MPRRARQLRCLTLAAAASLLLAGCGSGGTGFVPAAAVAGPDESAIRNVITGYAHALASGHGDTLCALLDAATQQRVAETAPAGALNESPAAACAQAIAQTSAQLTAPQRTALNSVAVRTVVVEGDIATVSDSEITATGASTPAAAGAGTIVLVRQGGPRRWLISQID